MPTFDKIGAHPDLARRLVTKVHHTAISAATNDNNVSAITNNYVPVATPLALLARHPTQLHVLVGQKRRLQQDDEANDNSRGDDGADHDISSVPLSLSQSLQLRYEVARATTVSLMSKHGSTTTTTNASQRFTGGTTASTLYQRQRCATTSPHALCTGSASLDAMLELPAASLLWGHVTQIAGAPGSGKTQVALQLVAAAAAAAAAVASHTCWYLSGPAMLAPAAQRLAQLLSTKPAALQAINMMATHNAADILAALGTIAASAAAPDQQQQQPRPGIVIVVLDGLSTLVLRDDPLLPVMARSLLCLARRHQIAIVVTNGSTKDGRPALGPRHWHSLVDHTLWLERRDINTSFPNAAALETTSTATSRTMMVHARWRRRHGFDDAAEACRCRFAVTSAGLRDV